MNVVNQQPLSEGPLNDIIDPRSFDEEATTGPINDLVDLPVDNKELTKVLKLGKNLSDGLRETISIFLKRKLGCVCLETLRYGGDRPCGHMPPANLDSDKKLVRQKRCAMDTERYKALKDKVHKLLACDFIK